MGKLIVNIHKEDFEKFSRETINGLLFSVVTPFEGLTPDALKNINVKMTKMIDGKKTDKLLDLSLFEIHALMFANNAPLSEKTFQIGREFTTGIFTYNLPFYFGTNEVLKDGEELLVEVQNKGLAGALAKDEDVQLIVETIPSIGLKTFNLVVERIKLPNDRTSHDLSLGSDVQKVIYIAGPDDSDYPLQSIDVRSDKLENEWSQNVIYNQLNETVEPDTSYSGTPIFLLSPPLPLNELRMKIDFDAVGGDRTVLVVKRVITPQIANKLVTKSAIHNAENMQHIKMSATTNCSCS